MIKRKNLKIFALFHNKYLNSMKVKHLTIKCTYLLDNSCKIRINVLWHNSKYMD